MPTKAERAEAQEKERAALEVELVKCAEKIDKLDAERSKLIVDRDRLIRKLGKSPHRYASRRVGRLANMTYQNAALILTPKKKAPAKRR